jgi:hypothetical protein
MRDQPLEPGELVLEARPGLRVAVRQIDRRDDQVVAAVRVVRIARQPAPAQHGVDAAGEHRDTVP